MKKSLKIQNKSVPISPKFSLKIWLVALFGLFLSMSTQMLYSHLALFLKFNCKISVSQIAAIDGFVECLSYFTRIFSGAVSDYLHNRNLLLIIGCSVSILIKPIFAFAHSISIVVFSEIVERLGSGIQASPRDALIADLSDKKKLGSSFGFCRALKTTGGVIGSITALIIIYFSDNNYRLLFVLSALPAIVSLFCILRIQSPLNKRQQLKKFDNPFQKKHLKSLDKTFWLLILLAFICEAGHIGESLLTLRSTHFFSQVLAGMTSIFATFGQIVFAYVFGIASDRVNKLTLLKLSLSLVVVSYLVMFFDNTGILFLLGVLISCGQFAVMQLLFLSMINIHVSRHLRGTAIGVFYCVIGLAYAVSTNIGGFLCENFGYNFAFLYVLIPSCIAFILVCLIKKE